MKLYSRMMLIGCTCIATLALSAGVTYAQTTGACCLPNGICQSATQLSCTDALGLNGSFQGIGNLCTAPEACCLTDGTCVMLDPLCCTDQGGTPQGVASVCGGSVEACCLPDDTCIMADTLCCTAQGGTPQGVASVCGGSVEACCLPNDTCIMADTLCCTAQGGTPQGAGSSCTPVEGCCLPLPYGTCSDLDPLCCLAVGGVPCGPGNLCKGDLNNNGLDDACEDPSHPIPAISDYGLAALLLLTAVAGVVVIRRSRRGHAAA